MLEIFANNVLGVFTMNVEGKIEGKTCYDNYITLIGFTKDGDDDLPKFMGRLQDQSVRVGIKHEY
jgi:hypothetical protein